VNHVHGELFSLSLFDSTFFKSFFPIISTWHKARALKANQSSNSQDKATLTSKGNSEHGA